MRAGGPSSPPCPPAQRLTAGAAPPSQPPASAAIQKLHGSASRPLPPARQGRVRRDGAARSSSDCGVPGQRWHPALRSEPKAKPSISPERLFPLSRNVSWPLPGSSGTWRGLHALKQQPPRSPELGRTGTHHARKKGARIPAFTVCTTRAAQGRCGALQCVKNHTGETLERANPSDGGAQAIPAAPLKDGARQKVWGLCFFTISQRGKGLSQTPAAPRGPS